MKSHACFMTKNKTKKSCKICEGDYCCDWEKQSQILLHRLCTKILLHRLRTKSYFAHLNLIINVKASGDSDRPPE